MWQGKCTMALSKNRWSGRQKELKKAVTETVAVGVFLEIHWKWQLIVRFGGEVAVCDVKAAQEHGKGHRVFVLKGHLLHWIPPVCWALLDLVDDCGELSRWQRQLCQQLLKCQQPIRALANSLAMVEHSKTSIQNCPHYAMQALCNNTAMQPQLTSQGNPWTWNPCDLKSINYI